MQCTYIENNRYLKPNKTIIVYLIKIIIVYVCNLKSFSNNNKKNIA